MKRCRLIIVSVFLTTLSLLPVLGADWHVVNNLPESFTIIVTANDGSSSKLQLAKNKKGGVKLGKDRHKIRLISQGGNQYNLRPMDLLNRTNPNDPTELKDILTPDGRDKRGNRKYDYMNQDGFREANKK